MSIVTCPSQQVLGHLGTRFWSCACGFPTFLIRSPRGGAIYQAQLGCDGCPEPGPKSELILAPWRFWIRKPLFGQVFDDPRVGLSREPFIAGIDTMIDRIVAKIPDSDRGFRAIFSAAPFPGYTEKLEWRREESGGNWYYNDHFKGRLALPGLVQVFPDSAKIDFYSGGGEKVGQQPARLPHNQFRTLETCATIR